MNIGEVIKTKRESLGLTQDELADKVGVSQGLLSMIERGSKPPSLPLCKVLAKEFGCSVSDLVDNPI